MLSSKRRTSIEKGDRGSEITRPKGLINSIKMSYKGMGEKKRPESHSRDFMSPKQNMLKQDKLKGGVECYHSAPL